MRSVMEHSQMGFHKGEIHLTNFNPAKGGEMGKLRPALIISDEESNKILDTVIVIPLSTVVEPDALPYRYKVSKRQQLHKESDLCINEIRALSKTRIKEHIADLGEDELKIVLQALCQILT